MTSNPVFLTCLQVKALSHVKAHVKHGYGSMAEKLMPGEGKYLQSITDATKYSIFVTTYGRSNTAIIDPKAF